MMKWLAVLLALILFSSGCSLSQINDVALIDYERGDNAGEVSLKTAGNIVVWAAALPVGLVYVTVMGMAQSGGASGGISRDGVTFDERSDVDQTNRP